MADKGKEAMHTSGSGNMASSSSSVNTTTLELDNPSQPLWRYVKKLGKAPGGGGNVIFSCNFCNKTFTGSYTRCKAHLLHISGHGIRPCEKVNKETLKQIQKEHDAAETKKSSAKSSELSVPLYAIEEGEDALKKRKMNMASKDTKTLEQNYVMIIKMISQMSSQTRLLCKEKGTGRHGGAATELSNDQSATDSHPAAAATVVLEGGEQSRAQAELQSATLEERRQGAGGGRGRQR
ncbi:hypothetical protein EJ110_NYTH43172 [Nymphaea thermarum]|nr:hypothetical protein EJ110_NYTH43172 [Nymphaea thermarum]